jgi:hypothetical protein
MALSTAQLATLRAAILAETDPAFVAWRTDGAQGAMAEFYNAAASPIERAWMSFATAKQLDLKSDYSAFDGLSQGKRDAWSLVLQYAPRDCAVDDLGGGVNSVRKALADIWTGSAPANAARTAILNAVTRPITKAEKLLGGSATATQSTVTALVLAWEGTITTVDIYLATKEA